MDAAGNTSTLTGLTVLKNVEFTKMGQLNNFNAAIMFENSKRTTGDFSLVENCVIHHAVGWAIHIKNSSNITLKNSDIFGGT